MSRCLLHKNQLDAFLAWCEEKGIPTRAPSGVFQVAQVRAHATDWYCIYDRLDAPEHYTVDKRLEPTVRRFIQPKSKLAQLETKLAKQEAAVKLAVEAFQSYIDEHEECLGPDDWMAMTCSVEAHHVADEALAALKECGVDRG